MDDKNSQPETQDALDKPASTEPSLNSLEELSQGNDKDAAAAQDQAEAPGPQKPKKKGIKRLLGFFNIYMVIFIFLLVVGGAVFAVFYLNSKKVPTPPKISVEDLSSEAINRIASEGQASIGDPDLLLNVQSNAVFAGQILARGDVNIAGKLQLGQGLNIPSITVSGSSNLGTAQVNQLSVANSMVVQGELTVQRSLNVGGAATFNGAITAQRVVTSSLTLSGTGVLEVNNHIKISGPNPGHSVGGAVGAGGSASVSGSDTAGRVNINTGQSTPPGCFITVNFRQRFTGNPRISLTPTSAGAALTTYYATTTPTSFSVCTAQGAPTGSTLDFNYFIVE
jgi:cytoskeletal protein CcmA (bactofilin family)